MSWRQWAWCLYDWANSAFALVCMTALLPAVLTQVINRELGSPYGTVAWGWFATAGTALSLGLSPILGHWADTRAIKRPLLASLVLVGGLACWGVGLTVESNWSVAGSFYVIAASAFALSNVLYDALLFVMAAPKDWHRLSAAGYAAGYLGGAVALVIALWFWVRGAASLTFGLVGAWWVLFAVPLFVAIAEPSTGDGFIGWVRLRERFWHLQRNRPALRFLVAFWLYNDGIGTVVKMAGAYGSHLGIPLAHVVGALLLAQAVGVPSTLLFGMLASRWGAKRMILFALGIYTVVAIWALHIHKAFDFWLLAALVGVVQGGAQALSRSFYARFVPPGAEAVYFSFFDVSGRLAGLLGPGLFALATQFAGNPAYGVAITALLFLSGGLLLTTVPEEGGPEEEHQLQIG